VLISAMAGVTSARLDIAGAGPEEAALRKLAGEVAPGRVQFLGRLTKTEVARRLGSSAVMVLPARWYENQPMSILEAFGAGTPVITSRLGGAPELVDDGEDGLLVPPDDPVALATAIDQLLADPERARKMGLAGRSKVQAQFTPEVHLERLSALYAEATQAVTS
jgi:glycosyltransferase involved in cell wall biosynthesis